MAAHVLSSEPTAVPIAVPAASLVPAGEGTADPSLSSQVQDGDDTVLVTRTRNGDRAAYAMLVQRHTDRLHAIMLHLTNGDHEQAAEFVQEAFIRAWQRIARFDGRCAFGTWLYRLARNRALDLLSGRRHARLTSEHGNLPGSEGDPSQALERAETVAQVRAALASLPVEVREIILLRDFEDLDYEHIANHLEVPVGTVKSRLSRARAALREALGSRAP